MKFLSSQALLFLSCLTVLTTASPTAAPESKRDIEVTDLIKRLNICTAMTSGHCSPKEKRDLEEVVEKRWNICVNGPPEIRCRREEKRDLEEAMEKRQNICLNLPEGHCSP